MNDESLMTPKELATFLNKSKSWVYAACERGELPAKRLGRDLRFDRTEIKAWLVKKSQTVSHAQLKSE